MSDDDLAQRRFLAALQDAESKRRNALLANQVWQGLLEQRQEAALAYQRKATQKTKPPTEPRRLPAGMRIVSGPAYLEWRRKCAANPQLAQHYGWDPNRPPEMREDHIEALVGPADPEAAT